MRNTRDEIMTVLSRNRLGYISKFRPPVDEGMLRLKRSHVDGTDPVALYKMISSRMDAVCGSQDSINQEGVDGLFQTLNRLVSAQVRRYDSTAMLAFMPWFEKGCNLLKGSLSHSEGPGGWQHDVWESFGAVLTASAIHADPYVFSRAWKVFTDVMHGPIYDGVEAAGSRRAARIVEKVLVACARARSWEIADIVLAESCRMAGGPPGEAAPDAWAPAVHDAVTALLDRAVLVEDIAGLDMLITNAALLQGSVHGLSERWYMDSIEGCARLCAERGSYRLLEVVTRRLLEAEEGGLFDGYDTWLEKMGGVLNGIINGMPDGREKPAGVTLRNAVAEYRYDGVLRDVLRGEFGGRGNE